MVVMIVTAVRNHGMMVESRHCCYPTQHPEQYIKETGGVKASAALSKRRSALSAL